MATPIQVDGTDELTIELLRVLTDVADATRRVIAEVLGEFDLTESSAGLLWALGPGAAPASMRELAARLGCDPSNVTLMSDRLLDAGLVHRQTHPTDKRARVLVLTDRGHQVWTALSRQLHARSPLSALSRWDQQRLMDLLNAIHQHRTQHPPAP